MATWGRGGRWSAASAPRPVAWTSTVAPSRLAASASSLGEGGVLDDEQQALPGEWWDHQAMLSRRLDPEWRPIRGEATLRRMVLGPHHLAIQCARLEPCERFYREVLGLAVVRRGADEQGRERSVWLGARRRGLPGAGADRPGGGRRGRGGTRAPASTWWRCASRHRSERPGRRGWPRPGSRWSTGPAGPSTSAIRRGTGSGSRTTPRTRRDHALRPGPLPRRQLPLPAGRGGGRRAGRSRRPRGGAGAGPAPRASAPLDHPHPRPRRPHRRHGRAARASSRSRCSATAPTPPGSRRTRTWPAGASSARGAVAAGARTPPATRPARCCWSGAAGCSPATRSSGAAAATAGTAAIPGAWRRACSAGGGRARRRARGPPRPRLRRGQPAVRARPRPGLGGGAPTASRRCGRRGWPGEEPPASSLAEERASNPFLRAEGIEELVALRARRDGWPPPGPPPR